MSTSDSDFRDAQQRVEKRLRDHSTMDKAQAERVARESMDRVKRQREQTGTG